MKKNQKSPNNKGNNHMQKSSPKYSISNFQNIKNDAYNLELDKYQIEEPSITQKKLEMRMQFSEPKKYKVSDRIEILSKPKTDYLGKDFFQHKDFRGLFLADHQEALGPKAFKCVDQLNTQTVRKFSEVPSFKETIEQRKQIEEYYKAQARSRNKNLSNMSSKNE